MNVAICGRNIKKFEAEVLHKLLLFMVSEGFQLKINAVFFDHLFAEHRLAIIPEVKTYSSALIGNEDFVLAVGGDGTILETARLVKDSSIPVIGLNTGRLGFLSDIPLEEGIKAIKQVQSNNYIIENRSLLHIKGSSGNEHFNTFPFALNEVTVLKKDTGSMISIHTYVDNHFLCTFWADGLIVASPTGSTAYNLSCGGPIIEPSSNSIVITPISPHNLSARPIILSDKRKVTLRVEGREDQYLLTLDSRSEVMIKEEEIIIEKAPFYLGLIKLADQSFYDTLRNKLNFGVDKRN
jgi:NAD+ kinase